MYGAGSQATRAHCVILLECIMLQVFFIYSGAQWVGVHYTSMYMCRAIDGGIMYSYPSLSRII